MWLEWPSGGAGAFCLNARTLAEVSVPRFAASCLRYSYKEKQKHSRYVVLVKSICSHSREWLARTLLGEEATFCCVFSTSLISNAILYCELSRLLALLFGIKRSICTSKHFLREHERSYHHRRCNRSERTSKALSKHKKLEPMRVKYRAKAYL